jgi:hypothetical protein
LFEAGALSGLSATGALVFCLLASDGRSLHVRRVRYPTITEHYVV